MRSLAESRGSEFRIVREQLSRHVERRRENPDVQRFCTVPSFLWDAFCHLIEFERGLGLPYRPLRPSVEVLDFQKDDLLLCCSDGVWEFLSNGDALNIVAQADTLRKRTHSFSQEKRSYIEMMPFPQLKVCVF